MTEKRCSKCKTTKPVTDFHRERATKTGLLCTRCNFGIAQLGENPDTLRAAIAYLERG